jgi:delta-aminolevulinic acid dehydratase/porphobilinogen synthase
MKTKTTTTVWLIAHSSLSPNQVITATGEQLVANVCLTALDMAKHGYTMIGAATIEFDLIGPSEMIDNKIVALRAELQTVKADAQVKVQKLEDQLNSLLAIEVTK